jgi:hypothetical protein
MGVVEGDACPVEAYLASGGDPTRKLTAAECSLLARPGVYEIGHTLVHLAVKLHRWVRWMRSERGGFNSMGANILIKYMLY